MHGTVYQAVARVMLADDLHAAEQLWRGVGRAVGREVGRKAVLEVRLEEEAAAAWAAAMQAEARAARLEARAARLEGRVEGGVEGGCEVGGEEEGGGGGGGEAVKRRGQGNLALGEATPTGMMVRARESAQGEVEARTPTQGAGYLHHGPRHGQRHGLRHGPEGVEECAHRTALTGTPAGTSSQRVLPTDNGAIPHVTTPHATPAACRAKGGALEGSRRSPAVSPPLPLVLSQQNSPVFIVI